MEEKEPDTDETRIAVSQLCAHVRESSVGSCQRPLWGAWEAGGKEAAASTGRSPRPKETRAWWGCNKAIREDPVEPRHRLEAQPPGAAVRLDFGASGTSTVVAACMGAGEDSGVKATCKYQTLSARRGKRPLWTPQAHSFLI